MPTQSLPKLGGLNQKSTSLRDISLRSRGMAPQLVLAAGTVLRAVRALVDHPSLLPDRALSVSLSRA